jgi:histidinol-phosphate phosphatase family protein
MFDLTQIDNNWTLFLDRDGVINVEKKDEYVLNVNEFFFLDGVLEALPLLAKKIDLIVIVTNQRCIAKGMMTLDDLQEVHTYMMEHINKAGGRIDKIYFCPDMDSDNRKPNPGMAFQAKADYPSIDFSKSIMIGNKLSDMQFGRNAGINTVFAATTNPDTEFPHPLIDYRVNTLLEFATELTKL